MVCIESTASITYVMLAECLTPRYIFIICYEIITHNLSVLPILAGMVRLLVDCLTACSMYWLVLLASTPEGYNQIRIRINFLPHISVQYQILGGTR
jgi:hypothetical protein